MKKSVSLIVVCLLSFIGVKAQFSHSVSVGAKMVSSSSNDVYFHYIDESPSMDNLSTPIEQKGNLAIELNYRFQENDPDKKLKFFVGFQGYLGAINGVSLNPGISYGINEESSIKIRPEISAVLGYSTKKIGEIKNNDVFIQVNDTKFKDYTNVNASLVNSYLGIKPGIRIVLFSKENYEIGLGVNYQLSLKYGSISFSGEDSNGDKVTEKEDIKEDNVGFFVDGKKTDEIPYSPDGFEFKLFYNF